MSSPFARRLQFAAASVMFVAYAGLSYYSNSFVSPNLGAALALLPMTAIVLILSWRATPLPLALVITAAVGVALYLLWPLLTVNYPLLYLIQESTVYALLGLTFLGTLRAGKTALCTQLADRVHGPLAAHEVLYTRRVTAAWGAFFFAVAALSLALFAGASLKIWSFYINFCVPLMILGMFAIEYGVRRRVLPNIKRVGVMATMRVYFTSPKVS